LYDNPNETGTDRLSSIGEYNSVSVAISIDIKAKYRLISIEKRIIIEDDIKKARDPSSVLFLILIVPYILPNIAAIVSDIIIINNEIAAIFSEKKKIINSEDKKT
tara:strand:- start:69328 stop:69642 length:315 start_codon:yes stop_codon:yes gene_type:complete